MGQKFELDQFIGSWQLMGYEISGQFSLVDPSLISITTNYSDGVFQTITKGYSDDNAETVIGGTWALEQMGGRIARWYLHGIPHQDNVKYGNTFDEIGEVTDSTLVILGFEGKQKVKIIYMRVADPGRLDDDYVPTPQYSSRSKHQFLLVNSQDSTKRVRIKPSVGVSFTDEAADLEYVKRNIHWSGTLLDVSDSSVRMFVQHESIAYETSDGMKSKIENDYFFANRAMERVVEPDRIQHLTYTSPSRNTSTAIGSTIATVGALTALLLAPLASINYKEGGFNSDRYFLLAGGGLAGSSVGIPLLLLGKEKKYRLSGGPTKTGKHYWYLRKE